MRRTVTLVEVQGNGSEEDVASTLRRRTTRAGHGYRVAPGPTCRFR